MIAISNIPLVFPPPSMCYCGRPSRHSGPHLGTRYTKHKLIRAPYPADGLRRKIQSQDHGEILWRRAAGELYEDIAERFGVSRERIRQILAAYDADGRIKQLLLPARIYNFKKVMFAWLRWAGWQYCWGCRQVKCSRESFPAKSRWLCRQCNASRARKTYRNSDKMRQYMAKYNKEHPEYSTAYQLRQKRIQRPGTRQCSECGLFIGRHGFYPELLHAHKNSQGEWCKGLPLEALEAALKGEGENA